MERNTPAGLLSPEAILNRQATNLNYLDRHLEGITEKYPGYWLAVGHERIVGRNRTYEGLFRSLDRRGIDIIDVAIIGGEGGFRGVVLVPVLEVESPI